MKKTTNERPVTSQQRRFLSEYADSLDARSSALKAGYSAKSAITQARELLGREKYLKALDEIITQKAMALEICPAFVVKKYLELIFWASADSETPKDPVLLLRALDGLCKHLNRATSNDEGAEESMLTKIIGLNQEKI